MTDTEVAAMPKTETLSMLGAIEKFFGMPNANLDGLKLLIDMREREIARVREESFYRAFSAMQPHIPAIAKTGEIKDGSGRARSKYALFEDINEAVKPVLAEYGFGVFFREEITPSEIRVTLVIFHRDGHKLEWGATLPTDNSGAKSPIQAIGSTISYTKRYLLIGALNVTTCGEDDDGVTANVAKKAAVKEEPAPVESKEFLKYWSDSLHNLRSADNERAVKDIGTEMYNAAKKEKNRARMAEVAGEVESAKKALAKKADLLGDVPLHDLPDERG